MADLSNDTALRLASAGIMSMDATGDMSAGRICYAVRREGLLFTVGMMQPPWR